MKSTGTWIFVCVCLVAVVFALGANDAQKPRGVFASLKVGQSVALKDDGAGFSITFFEPELPQSHKVIEIGSDYVVLRDIAEITETTIPIYSVKAVVKVRTKTQ